MNIVFVIEPKIRFCMNNNITCIHPSGMGCKPPTYFCMSLTLAPAEFWQKSIYVHKNRLVSITQYYIPDGGTQVIIKI